MKEINGFTLIGLAAFVLLIYYITYIIRRRDIRRKQFHKQFKMKHNG